MKKNLRFDIADQRLSYDGPTNNYPFSDDRVIEFNLRHRAALESYGLSLKSGKVHVLSDKLNGKSNLGAFRNRKLRESAVVAAGLAAISVGLHGRGAVARAPKEQQTKEFADQMKRANDRTAAQVMAEVLQTTTETLSMGEEVMIESAITEGARAKPGKEVGGNPTIAVGAVFGKDKHRSQYGLPMDKNVTLLSMGNDVIDGTTKSVKGLHSSLTALFLTESHIKRHLPDIYVQRWASGQWFEPFNPREASLIDAAEIIAGSYGHKDLSKLSAFFIDRPRHYPAWDTLNEAGVTIPYDKDGDLFPNLVLGLDALKFPDGQQLNSMIGEIGGSAEWAVGMLPLVWRGGQGIGMLTSHSTLTRDDLSPEERWNQRFHYTEDEFMSIQDARFEQKPYFTVEDILEDPYAGGVSAFGAITDNYYLPFMKGVEANKVDNTIFVSVLMINSIGLTECWEMVFECRHSVETTAALMQTPKDAFEGLSKKELEATIGNMLETQDGRKRFRLFVNNEYYPALVPIRDKLVLLHGAVDGLIKRGALTDHDRDILDVTVRLTSDWWMEYDK